MQTVQQTLPSLSNITACIIPIGIDKIIEYEMSIVQQSFIINSIQKDWLQNWLKFKLKNNWWQLNVKTVIFPNFITRHNRFKSVQTWLIHFLAAKSFNLIYFSKIPRIDAKSFMILMSVLYHIKLLNQNTAVHIWNIHALVIHL